MSKDQWLRISPRTGKPVREGAYRAGPGRGNHSPARPPGSQATEPLTSASPKPLEPPLTSDVVAENAHTLLKRIYNDTSLPLYARMDAARIAVRFETPTLTATKIEPGPNSDLAERVRRG